MFEIVERQNSMTARNKVIGIGGGGGNAVNTMIGARLTGVDFMVANTDAQSLAASQAPVRVQLGGMVTKGLGAGANPEIGRRAALEDQEQIREYLEGSDMIFITAGMGASTIPSCQRKTSSPAREFPKKNFTVLMNYART